MKPPLLSTEDRNKVETLATDIGQVLATGENSVLIALLSLAMATTTLLAFMNEAEERNSLWEMFQYITGKTLTEVNNDPTLN